MITSKAANIDGYIAGFPEHTQHLLQQIRATIKQSAPDAEEMISYAIPTFKLKGRPLIYFAGYKNHVAVYPVPRENEAFQKELSAYKGGKGTVQFPLGKPLPLKLITKILKFRMKEFNNKTERKKVLFKLG